MKCTRLMGQDVPLAFLFEMYDENLADIETGADENDIAGVVAERN